MGSGLALADFDGDSDLDILLLDTGSTPGASRVVPAVSELWLNVTDVAKRDLRFERAAAPNLAGISAMGACTGDVDGDGDADVYVTGIPHGRLLVNTRGSLVASATDPGPLDAGWGTSCVFLDHDADGDLDLFVAHYVAWSAATERTCGGEKPGFRSYCPPDRYDAEPDRLFANDGSGRFKDVSVEAGLAGERGKGLGVVAADLDGNGWTDLYVANDQTASSLWLNSGGIFRDVALPSGTALSEDGRAQAGMGVDAGDVDGDGRIDLTKTNLDLDTNNLYLGLRVTAGVPRFRDVVQASALAEPSFMMLGFGALLADIDADGDLDSFVVNGHILPNVAIIRPDQSHAMRSQFFENAGAKGALPPQFRDARDRWQPAADARGVGRGLACGDLDQDGDLDLVETRNDGPVRLLRNDANPVRWIGLALKAVRSAPGAPGASVKLVVGDVTRTGLRRTGGSYLSASDERLLFSLAGAPKAPVHAVVSWPSRTSERFGPLQEGGYRELREGEGAPP